MKSTIEAILARSLAAAETLNHYGWTRSHEWNDQIKATAEGLMDKFATRADRCRRVLQVRYGA